MKDYPTAKELLSIESSAPQTIEEFYRLLSLCEKAYNTDYGLWEVKKLKNGKVKLWIATGGWSGNEDVVSAMKKNIYLLLGWQLSERGGAERYEWDLKTFYAKKGKT